MLGCFYLVVYTLNESFHPQDPGRGGAKSPIRQTVLIDPFNSIYKMVLFLCSVKIQ